MFFDVNFNAQLSYNRINKTHVFLGKHVLSYKRKLSSQILLHKK